jgi:glutathione S-transferase
MIELYGSPMSSSGRTRWMLEEIGVTYDYKRVDTRNGGTRTPEYLRMYGGGKVPVLRDGDLTLGESMAINFYLAEKYKPELMPSDLAQRAQVYQWSFWATTNLQPELLTVMFEGMKPAEQRQPALADAAKDRAAPQLAFVEQALAGREFLVGNRFSVADVNAGSVANLARATRLLAGYPNASAWMERLAARPAYQRAAKD